VTGPPTGRHIGARLADLMHDARVAAAERIIPAETEHRAAYHRAFMESVEDEYAPMMRDVLGQVLEHPDCPDEAKAFLGPLLGPEHQAQFFLTLVGLLGLGLAGPQAAAAGWVQRLQNLSLHTHGDLKLTPAEAALAVIKGVAGLESMADEARYAGMTGDTFNGLVEITGEPPGPVQLMEALRRGFIDAGRFDKGIRQSRVRDEWVDVLTALRYAPPGPGEVVAGYLKGHLSEQDAAHRLSEAGIDPSNLDWLYLSAGRPPGVQQMLELWNRGAASQADVEMAVRESDIHPKWTPKILEMRRYFPPPRTTVAMLREGAVDDATARTWLAAHGVNGPDQDAYLKGAHSGRATSVKEITAAEALEFYTLGGIGRTQAADQLAALHYTPAAVADLLALTDIRAANRLTAAKVGKVRTAYDGHKIDRPSASNALDALSIDTPTRDRLLAQWDTERDVNVRHVTEAFLVKAAKAGAITKQEFIDRHTAMGYTADDAELLWTVDVGL
jgi:hypothetical protein